MRPLFTTINSGQTVSGIIEAKQVNAIRSIHVPSVTSGDLLAQGSVDPTSGSFARFRAGSGDLRFAVGVGSCFLAAPLGDTLPTPYLRLESAVAQADVRTLTLLVR